MSFVGLITTIILVLFIATIPAQAKTEARLEPKTPAQEEAYRLLVDGSKLLKDNKPFRARQPLEEAARLWPEESAIHYNLGFCYHECGNFPQAINEFETALRINPKLKQCIVNIASCYQVQGKTQEAVAWFENYLKKNPGSEDRQSVKGLIAALQQHSSKQIDSDPGLLDFYESICWQGRPRRWPVTKLPIRLFITNGTDSSGRAVADFREEFNYIFLSAFDAWVKASQNRLAYVLVSDPAQADIACTWTDDPAFLHDEGNKVEQGVARVEFKDNNGEALDITNVHITLLVKNRETGQPLSADEMKKACLHELGHALGFAGHSSNPKDVMFFSESPAVWPALTKRDKATMLRLYSQYPLQ